jgi:hypothetical protein
MQAFVNITTQWKNELMGKYSLRLQVKWNKERSYGFELIVCTRSSLLRAQWQFYCFVRETWLKYTEKRSLLQEFPDLRLWKLANSLWCWEACYSFNMERVWCGLYISRTFWHTTFSGGEISDWSDENFMFDDEAIRFVLNEGIQRRQRSLCHSGSSSSAGAARAALSVSAFNHAVTSKRLRNE